MGSSVGSTGGGDFRTSPYHGIHHSNDDDGSTNGGDFRTGPYHGIHHSNDDDGSTSGGNFRTSPNNHRRTSFGDICCAYSCTNIRCANSCTNIFLSKATRQLPLIEYEFCDVASVHTDPLSRLRHVN